MQCAELLDSRGGNFRDATSDGSPSLDQLRDRYAMRRHRALFRNPGGHESSPPPFEQQRQKRQRRLARLLQTANSSDSPHPTASNGGGESALADLNHIYLVEVSADANIETMLATLRADPHVEYVQPDYAMDLDRAPDALTVPTNDPFLSSEGAWGQPYADLWGLEQIQAPAVWAEAQGEGAVVAVVDTGLDRFHPDIVDNVWVNPGEDLNGNGRVDPEDLNGLDDDDNGFIDDLTGFDFANSEDVDEDGFYDGTEDVSDSDPFDDRGHGTHVAGTIAAVGGNGIGIVGVAPRAKIMALKGFPQEGSATASDLWRAVLYAAENGATVINTSWSCGEPCPDNPLALEVLGLVEALGSVVVSSAGNASRDVLFNSPENGDLEITVGALGFDEQSPNFTNVGWGIDLVAPGGGPSGTPGVQVSRRNILSLLSSAIDPADEIFSINGEAYWRLSGTSMSAPHVAGAVAILRALRPELKPRDVRRLLRMTARDLGLPGHDPQYGAGLLDLPALLSAELPAIELAFLTPDPGQRHDPRDGPFVLQLRAAGEDLDPDSLEIEVSPGLSGRTFAPLELASSSLTAGVLTAEWDVENVVDGPYVLRVRAHRIDAPPVDEVRVVSIERNAPLQLTPRGVASRAPALSGRRVVFTIPEAVEGEGDPEIGGDRDLAIGAFFDRSENEVETGAGSDGSRTGLPVDFEDDRNENEDGVGEDEQPTRFRVLSRAGDQLRPTIDGRTLAWISREDGVSRVEWCRLRRRLYRGSAPVCLPETIAGADDVTLAPVVGGGWIVWQKGLGLDRVIQGCRVGARRTRCTPRDLIQPDASTEAPSRVWTLRSFDGRNLLIQAGSSLALCRVKARGPGCVPIPVETLADQPNPVEPLHDESLMVFTDLTLESVPPVGCLPGELLAECRPERAVVIQYRACWLEGADRDLRARSAEEGTPASFSCDSIPVSPRARLDYFAGMHVDGRRIVWSVGSATENPGIFFCEFDSERNECPVQRLMGAPAEESDPFLDGNRVVWREARGGPQGVWGFALPELVLPGPLALRAGRRFWIPVRVDPGSASSLSYSIEGLDGVSPESARAKVFDTRPAGGWAYLTGRLPKKATGTSQWRIRAEGEGGLYTESTLSFVAKPLPNGEARKRRRFFRGRW